MKKLMNKKLNLFGKEVSIFLLVMVAMSTFASAALVTYLAGPVTGTADIAAPLTMTISDVADTGYTDAVTFTGMHGGETITAYTKVVNAADVDITSPAELTITSAYDFNTTTVGTEFAIIASAFDGSSSETLTCTIDTLNPKKLVCPTSNVVVGAGLTKELKFVVTANIAIQPDTYTFSANVKA